MPPGASYFYGLLACSNPRRILSNKPRTVTLDAEMVLGKDENNDMVVMSALLHHYVPTGQDDPEGGKLYLVNAKVASITDATEVGDEYDVSEYEVILESTALQRVPKTTQPMRPVITIGGVTGKKTGDRQFNIDINHYVSGETRTAAHTCLFPEGNKRFANPPIPRPGSTLFITGAFYGKNTLDTSGMKRLAVEISEIAFIANDSGPSTPVKGKKSTMHWGGDKSEHSDVSPSPKSSKKRAHSETEDKDTSARKKPRQSNAAASSSGSRKTGDSAKAKGKQPVRSRSEDEDEDGGSSSGIEVISSAKSSPKRRTRHSKD